MHGCVRVRMNEKSGCGRTSLKNCHISVSCSHNIVIVFAIVIVTIIVIAIVFVIVFVTIIVIAIVFVTIIVIVIVIVMNTLNHAPWNRNRGRRDSVCSVVSDIAMDQE